MSRTFVSLQNGKVKQIRGRFGGECERAHDEQWANKCYRERKEAHQFALAEAREEGKEFMEIRWSTAAASKITGMEEVLHGTRHSIETVGRIIEITFKHKEGSQTIITRKQRTKQVHFKTGGRNSQRQDFTLKTDGFGRLTSACAA